MWPFLSFPSFFSFNCFYVIYLSFTNIEKNAYSTLFSAIMLTSRGVRPKYISAAWLMYSVNRSSCSLLKTWFGLTYPTWGRSRDPWSLRSLNFFQYLLSVTWQIPCFFATALTECSIINFLCCSFQYLGIHSMISFPHPCSTHPVELLKSQKILTLYVRGWL